MNKFSIMINNSIEIITVIGMIMIGLSFVFKSSNIAKLAAGIIGLSVISYLATNPEEAYNFGKLIVLVIKSFWE